MKGNANNKTNTTTTATAINITAKTFIIFFINIIYYVL